MIAPDFLRDFVKVPRPLVRQLMPDKNLLAVYLELVCRARYVAGADIQLGRGVLSLERGQLVVGRGELAAATFTSENVARGALDRLKAIGLITSKTTSRGTVVTIVGYGETADGESGEPPAEPPAVHQQSTSGPPAVHQRSTTKKKLRDVEKTRRLRSGEVAAAAPAPTPASWKLPAGGLAERKATERIAAGEITASDVALCLDAFVQKGAHLRKNADARFATWIANQKPARAPGADRDNFEADDYGPAPWEAA